MRRKRRNMQQKVKNMKKMKILLGLSFMMALNLSALAGGTTPSGFTFTYNVGTVTNYHAYAVVSQVGSGTQPRGTVVLGNWWVKDLGKAVGSATVTCPPPVTPKGTTSSVLGILLLANASDVGGKPYTHPVVDVQIFTVATPASRSFNPALTQDSNFTLQRPLPLSPGTSDRTCGRIRGQSTLIS